MEETVYHQTIAKLKASKIRVTPQRDAIIKYLIASEAHPTAEKKFTQHCRRSFRT